MITTISILLSSLILSLIEGGVREAAFQRMNQGVQWAYEKEDKTIKTVNLFVVALVYVGWLLYLDALFLLPICGAIRLIFLDGSLNLKRKQSFWHVGERDFWKILKGWEIGGKLMVLVLAGGLSYFFTSELIKSLFN